MKFIRFLNTDILAITQEDLLRDLKKGVLFTPNLDHLVKLQKDRDFYEAYQQAEWIVCDSMVLYFCSKFLKNKLPDVVPGSSFFTEFYRYHAADENCKIFLLGAMDGVAEKAKAKINAAVGREIIVGAHSPSFGFERKLDEIENIIQIVNESGANVVLVGVGAPKQEKFIMKYKDRMPGVDIWMALGATIDFEAGNISRAPIFMQKCAMEWLYRFFKEPKRMFRRYFLDDLKFFWLFLKQILGVYKNPFKT
ncbi:polymer biosynthesis protein, WecB/TagA/CpsF family [Fibrobacter sp. UWH9]|uniref:WecB/TagA/CpsF family glycosyltransferase n=1 Tax=unclassified Fibrobacter TaxID=2634177 RepID=UPI00091B6FA6|nr:MULTISPECIES: WecB/TagA/CpsF family glycosyltransferase [unclassified Fibrobacter]OWV02727.1 glycosyltransferase [Fibrobacter sp. UWH3]SHH64713.1 polymer biosynthesis protein, WecB/TagA/CpsF family [Fibrobacter sp. UWH9]SHK73626.1 polymer biosynthesis protein, WecB/TagA/CpsF family [Fibrobacter sp. UWH6]